MLTGPAWLEYERRARRASWWDVWFDVLTLVAVIALRADVYYPVQVPRETWMDKSKYMTVKELAEHYGRHADTIRRWIKAGIIPSE